MESTSVSKTFMNFNRDALHKQQKPRDQTRNKRRQQQRWRRKCTRNLSFCQQHIYSAFLEPQTFLWKIQNDYQQNDKPITVVAGDSMVSRLIEHNLQTPKDFVKLTFESGCNCSKMLDWLYTIEGRDFMYNVRRLILVLGTNDLHVVRAEETVYRIKHTIESIRLLFPQIEIVWELLQWRTKPTRYLVNGFDILQEISKCNVMLLHLARLLHFQTINPALTRDHICHDNLHPTYIGSRVTENCIRSFLLHQ